MRFQKAEDVIAIIERRKNRGYGLDHFKQYMASLGNPQNRLRSIHIAGTNGKGSTTNDIRSILQAAGYKVGSFTSPFMITHLDRIRINNQDIRERRFLELPIGITTAGWNGTSVCLKSICALRSSITWRNKWITACLKQDLAVERMQPTSCSRSCR
ncbi:hypothetical protein AB9M62_25070 [Bacillales bacterium AN1005]